MRRWLWILLLCSPAFGAIARTGTPASHDCASATTCTVTYSPTAGNGLVVFVQDNATATISSVTDNAAGGSSTYTSIFSGACNTSGSTYNCGLYVACNVKAATVITANFSVADAGAIIVSEYTGQALATCGDQTSASVTGSSTAFTSGTTGTTTQAAELIIGAFLWDGGTTLNATSGSYNHIKDQNCSTCGSSIGLMDQIVASTGTFSATATAAATTTYNGRTATIKAAAAAAGAKPHAIIF
jgi:membrane-bound inhibitor of C-type lysozyme